MPHYVRHLFSFSERETMTVKNCLRIIRFVYYIVPDLIKLFYKISLSGMFVWYFVMDPSEYSSEFFDISGCLILMHQIIYERIVWTGIGVSICPIQKDGYDFIQIADSSPANVT